MSIDISIIIPLYNKEDFIDRTLRSILTQNISSWECIIVDDGSTDSSLKTVTNFIEKNPANWKIITQENSGILGMICGQKFLIMFLADRLGGKR